MSPEKRVRPRDGKPLLSEGRGVIQPDDLDFEVVADRVRRVYGRVEYLVRAVTGTHQTWVRAENITWVVPPKE